MCESQKRQATEGKSTAGSKIHDNNDGEEESAVLKLEGEVSLGDLIWAKLNRNTWWPALVVDENSVSESFKPGNRSKGKVLVRLYGSYDYLYADLTKYYSEFKMVLEQNNGSFRDIFDKALEKDLSRRESKKPKGQGSKSTANTRADASKGKKKLKPNNPRAEENARRKKRSGSNVEDVPRSRTSEQDETKKKLKRKSPSSNSQNSERSSPGKSPKSSARRMRVMQGLGLSAPPGSPFLKN
ncbi:hypothetical protein REPUB_Repub19eG0071000 [Reevesia pubescens]